MQISIIIPTFNRVGLIRDTLTSVLAAIRDSRDAEIVVVDNGSTDDTRAAVEQMARQRAAGRLRYLYEPMPGLLSGRHRGAGETQGEICAFLDDDVLLGEHWFDALADSFRDPAVGFVGGPSVPAYQATPPEWIESFKSVTEQGTECGWLSLFDGGREKRPMDPTNIYGLNFSVRRSTLVELGGFHPDNMPKHLQRFQGDGESGLTMKARAAGTTAIYHPDVKVAHVIPAGRLTVEYFEDRAFYQGVCQSYGEIRTKRGLVRAEKSLRAVVGSARRSLAGFRARRQVPEPQRRTARAHLAGFRFHQRAVAQDAALLEWVLRPTYWDYRLPGVAIPDHQ